MPMATHGAWPGQGGQLVQYELYRMCCQQSALGNTPGTDTVNGIGIGIMLNSTVYGRVPVQATPSAGTYNDTITVTVTYRTRRQHHGTAGPPSISCRFNLACTLRALSGF